MKRTKKKLIYTTAIVSLIISFLLANICGCNNSSKTTTENDAFIQIAYKLNEIGLDLSEISNSLSSEESTGREYLDAEDISKIENLNDALAEVETQIADINKENVATEEFVLLILEKETLRELANSIYSYIQFRDNNEQAEYVLGSFSGNSLNYDAEWLNWLSYLFDWEPNPYDNQQLMGFLFGTYMKSASDNCLLSQYEIDSRIFDVDKVDMQNLLDHNNENIERIIEEVKALGVAEEWFQVKEMLVDALSELDEQNIYLMSIDWPITDEATLEQMLRDYKEIRDKAWETIIPLIRD